MEDHPGQKCGFFEEKCKKPKAKNLIFYPDRKVNFQRNIFNGILEQKFVENVDY